MVMIKQTLHGNRELDFIVRICYQDRHSGFSCLS
jgi:hypothetical protein